MFKHTLSYLTILQRRKRAKERDKMYQLFFTRVLDPYLPVSMLYASCIMLQDSIKTLWMIDSELKLKILKYQLLYRFLK